MENGKNAMTVDDFAVTHQWHPQMILVSESPVTLHGFLLVFCMTGKVERFKIKLKVPNYPSLCDAQLYFGSKITYLYDEEFKKRVKVLMQSSMRVSSFLRQLQSLISTFVDGPTTSNDVFDDSVIGILQELQDAFDDPSEVEMLAGDNLDTITLSLYNVSLKLQRTKDNDCPWKVVYSDLPMIPGFGTFETNVTTLKAARSKFKQQVEMLEETWDSLREIDEHCYIIDPPEPKPSHLYRWISLSSSLFMLVKIDPLHPDDLPEIKFQGSEVEVEAKKNIVFNNIRNWDPNSRVLENLMMLLQINEFPRAQKDISQDQSQTITDEKCCICFSVEIEGHNFTDKICNNKKCMMHFHTSCLLQWLQAVPGNHFAFNQVHGTCPVCSESISCPVD